MPTLLKIRGLTRGKAAVGEMARGFRVRSHLGPRYEAGVKANRTIGTSNAAVTYTARYGGTWGNNLRVAQVVSGNNTPFSIAVTAEATSGDPVITVNSATDGAGLATTTANAAAAAVNAHLEASSFLTAAAGGTGASVIVAGAAADLTSGTNVGSAGERVHAVVGSKGVVVVDVDDPLTARALMRNPGKYVSLGQP